ncbi:class I SAM-dependent methyltransferase [Candidatus Izimaplasma bacterium]|nr:class I SAM-dependent methyltransferase [Candidatus Izimaplasma bacterium]
MKRKYKRLNVLSYTLPIIIIAVLLYINIVYGILYLAIQLFGVVIDIIHDKNLNQKWIRLIVIIQSLLTIAIIIIFLHDLDFIATPYIYLIGAPLGASTKWFYSKISKIPNFVVDGYIDEELLWNSQRELRISFTILGILLYVNLGLIYLLYETDLDIDWKLSLTLAIFVVLIVMYYFLKNKFISRISPFSVMTVSKLWNDPYISNQMLKYHLAFEDDIASRRLQTIEQTVEFIYNKFKPESLCDFGCGPGLYTNLFDEKNIKVTGVDFSTNSIAYARSQNSNIRYVEFNYLEVDLEDTFDVITMIYCDFTVLPLRSIKNLLDNVKRHLNENGKFLFDVHNYTFYDNFMEHEHVDEQTDGFYMEGLCEITHKNSKFEKNKVCLEHINAVGKEHKELYNWYQCYSKESITKILEDNGFEVNEIYSDTLGTLENEFSDAYFIECTKK